MKHEYGSVEYEGDDFYLYHNTDVLMNRFTEWMCAQIMHTGPYDDEPGDIIRAFFYVFNIFFHQYFSCPFDLPVPYVPLILHNLARERYDHPLFDERCNEGFKTSVSL